MAGRRAAGAWTLQGRGGGVRGGTRQAVGQQGRAHCRGEGGCQRGDTAGRRAAGVHTLQERGGVRGGTWQAVGQQGCAHCRRGGASEGGHGRP